MPDNIKRGVRTAGQALIALILTGALDRYTVEMLNELGIASDSAIRTGTALVMMFLSTWAWNATEDATGVSVLAPKDRVLGDQRIGTGLGEKSPSAGGAIARS